MLGLIIEDGKARKVEQKGHKNEPQIQCGRLIFGGVTLHSSLDSRESSFGIRLIPLFVLKIKIHTHRQVAGGFQQAGPGSIFRIEGIVEQEGQLRPV